MALIWSPFTFILLSKVCYASLDLFDSGDEDGVDSEDELSDDVFSISTQLYNPVVSSAPNRNTTSSSSTTIFLNSRDGFRGNNDNNNDEERDEEPSSSQVLKVLKIGFVIYLTLTIQQQLTIFSSFLVQLRDLIALYVACIVVLSLLCINGSTFFTQLQHLSCDDCHALKRFLDEDGSGSGDLAKDSESDASEEELFNMDDPAWHRAGGFYRPYKPIPEEPKRKSC